MWHTDGLKFDRCYRNCQGKRKCARWIWSAWRSRRGLVRRAEGGTAGQGSEFASGHPQNPDAVAFPNAMKLQVRN